jgi:hypothetical protein
MGHTERCSTASSMVYQLQRRRVPVSVLDMCRGSGEGVAPDVMYVLGLWLSLFLCFFVSPPSRVNCRCQLL